MVSLSDHAVRYGPSRCQLFVASYHIPEGGEEGSLMVATWEPVYWDANQQCCVLGEDFGSRQIEITNLKSGGAE